jgi:hypothetical protein
MNEELELLKRVTNHLRWTIRLAESGCEKAGLVDTLVSGSIDDARAALEAAQGYLNWVYRQNQGEQG